MITHIEIDGFKSFHNFVVDLRPFQVFIGANGAGKSNLFDAIVLLSRVAADNSLYDAFRENRGEIGELFTVYADGSRARDISFAVEMLIDKTVTDELGTTAEVSYTRLRYEVKIERRLVNGFERLYVIHEALSTIIDDVDHWMRENISHDYRPNWIKRSHRAPYISTVVESGQKNIYKHQDGKGGRKQKTVVGNLERTVLSTINNAEYPTAYAVRQEMFNWRFLQFDPKALRTPSGVYSRTDLLPDGSNLAAVLYRLSREDKFALTDISREMANLVPGIVKVAVQTIIEREEYLIEATTQNGETFTSRVLSDGTLRLLALVTMCNDPSHKGIVCFEEPENGVHPFRLEQVVDVLKSLATDLNADIGPLKQVLVATHSPSLLSFSPHMMFVYMSGSQQARKTRMAPVVAELIEADATPERSFTWNQVKRFLSTDSLTNKIDELEQEMA